MHVFIDIEQQLLWESKKVMLVIVITLLLQIILHCGYW